MYNFQSDPSNSVVPATASIKSLSLHTFGNRETAAISSFDFGMFQAKNIRNSTRNSQHISVASTIQEVTSFLF